MVALAAPFVIFWLAYSRGRRWLMWIGTLGYATWLALQVKTWWLAYAFGASDSWELIDEIRLNIHPLLLGSGIPLFNSMSRQTDLELLECRLSRTAAFWSDTA